jgi:hypothetical protein
MAGAFSLCRSDCQGGFVNGLVIETWSRQMIRALIIYCVLTVCPVLALAQQPDSTGTAPADTAATAATASTAGDAGGAGFDVRLRALRERVEELKGRVFDSKTRLLLLREQIMHNLISESKARIVHRNTMSSSMDIEEIVYFLDGEKVYFRTNRDGKLASADSFEVFTGSVATGNHLLSVEIKMRANNGLFTYVDGYAFIVKSSFTFFANSGMEAQVSVVSFEKGGLAAPLQDRPSVRFGLKQKRLMSGDLSGGQDSAEAAGVE